MPECGDNLEGRKRVLLVVRCYPPAQIRIKMKQQDFDEAIKRLPSPTEIDTDIYIIPCVNACCRFVFEKQRFYTNPQENELVMWVLKEIRY